jgi:hypothetical protein
LLSRRAARKHLVASRLPKYFLRPRSAGSVSPGSGRPVRRELGYGPAVRLKPFRPHLTAGALSCALRSQRAQHAPTARARQAAGAHPGGFPARRPSPAPLEPHLHPVLDLRSSCARRGITPAFWLRTPPGVGPTGLPPASNTASPARTTTRSDCRSAAPPLPGFAGYRRASLPGAPQAPGPRPLSRVPRTTIRTFNARYAGGFLGARSWAKGACRGLRRGRTGSAPSLPPNGAGLLDDARSGFTRVADRAVASAPLRTRPLGHARGPRYRGPRRLPGPDSHRRAAPNLSLVMSCRTPFLHGTEQSRRTRP